MVAFSKIIFGETCGKICAWTKCGYINSVFQLKYCDQTFNYLI